jgi:CubicO group peptidase (beta-lactamase class C family)
MELMIVALFAAASAAPAAEIDARGQRVTQGLLPETAFRERYGPPASLADRMAYYNTPGVSIAVVEAGRVAWAKGFGVRERGRPEPVTERTLFQAGSISKPIFALAVMRLVQEGRLDLDEDVNRYLTSWKLPANGTWQPRVTLRQLRSGRPWRRPPTPGRVGRSRGARTCIRRWPRPACGRRPRIWPAPD